MISRKGGLDIDMGGDSKDLKFYALAPVKVKLAMFVSTLFLTGFIPLAPGTWGSAVTALVVYFLVPTASVFTVPILLLLFLAGVSAVNVLQKHDGTSDNPKIVIDEALGMLISVAFLPKTPFVFISAFIVFRVFDILKPYPVRLAEERMKGGLGVVMDDVIAGLLANILVRIANLIF